MQLSCLCTLFFVGLACCYQQCFDPPYSSTCYDVDKPKVAFLEVDYLNPFSVAVCASTDAGEVFCWGSGLSSSLGATGREENAYLSAKSVLGFGNPITVIGRRPKVPIKLLFGGYGFCVVRVTNELYCWGPIASYAYPDIAGTIGYSPRTMGSNLPPVVLPNGVNNIIEGCMGAAYSQVGYACILVQGTPNAVYCFGHVTTHGTLGVNLQSSTAKDAIPINFGASSPRQISCGSVHACALLNNGNVSCWGTEVYYSMFNASTGYAVHQPRILPLPQAAGWMPYSRVICGANSTCVIASNGSALCSGEVYVNGTQFSTMQPNLISYTIPSPVDFGPSSNFMSIIRWAQCTNNRCCFISSVNVSRCVGYNSANQALGFIAPLGNTSLTFNTTLVPNVTMPPLPDAMDVEGVVMNDTTKAMIIGPEFTSILLDSGRILTYGIDADSTVQEVEDHTQMCPVVLQGHPEITMMTTAYDSLNRNHNKRTLACMILNGRLRCYGVSADHSFFNPSGTPEFIDLGVSIEVSRPVAVAAGFEDVCAIMDANSLHCRTASGEVSFNDTIKLGNTPTLGAKQIVLSHAGGALLRTDGVTIAWGSLTLVSLSSGKEQSCLSLGAAERITMDMSTLAPLTFLGQTAVRLDMSSRQLCAITTTNTVVCHGIPLFPPQPGCLMNNSYSFLNPTGGEKPIDIAVGDFLVCVLYNDDRVRCLCASPNDCPGATNPDPPYTFTNPPGSWGAGRKPIDISASRRSVCALMNDSTVDCWGTIMANAQVYITDLLSDINHSGYSEAIGISAASHGMFLINTRSGVLRFDAYGIDADQGTAFPWSPDVQQVSMSVPNGVNYAIYAVPLLQCPTGHSGLSCDCASKGSTVDQTLQTTEIDCPEGYYANVVGQYECKPCPAGTQQLAEGATACEQCRPGTASLLPASKCNPCLPGFIAPFPGSDDCISCPQNYSAPGSGSITCVVCPNHKYTLGVGSSNCIDCTPCVPGEYLALPAGSSMGCGTCIPCPPDQFSNSSNALECFDCPEGTSSPGGASQCCGICPPGTRKENSVIGCHTCVVCSGNTFSNTSDSSSCMACPANTRAEPVDLPTACESCDDCLPGTQRVSGFPCDSCVNCSENTFSTEVNSANCQSCAVGKWTQGLTGALSCADCPGFPCPSGQYVIAGSTSTDCQTCGDCPAGTYSDQLNALSCSACPANQYPNDDIGATGCLPCPDCLPGTYRVPGSPCASCLPCTVNTFSTGVNNVSCATCPIGKWTQGLTGALSCADCPGFPCPSGQYVIAGSSSTECQTCGDCPAGTYSDQLNAIECSPCPANQYPNDVIGATDCLPCPDCLPGTYRVPGSPCASCLPCQVNTFSNVPNSDSCDSCPVGKWTEGLTGAVGCSDCPGFPCTFGQQIVAGSSSDQCPTCSDCLAGTYSDQLNALECSTCPFGEYPNAPVKATGCQPCPVCRAGEFYEETDFLGCPICRLCDENEFSEEEDSTSCMPCPEGSFTTGTGFSKCCPDCPPGWQLVGGTAGTTTTAPTCPTCVPCPVSSVSKVKNSWNCTDCDKGFYSVDRIDCRECDPGMVCSGKEPNSLKPGFWRAVVSDEDEDEEDDRSMSSSWRIRQNNGTTTPNNTSVPDGDESNLGEIQECWKSEACLGGDVTTTCGEGYSGPLCDVCADGYFLALDSCQECPEVDGASVAVLAIAVIVVIALVAFLTWRAVSAHVQGRSIKIKILLNYVQVLATVGGFTLRWSLEMKRFFGIADAGGNAGASQILSAECTLDEDSISYYDVFTFYMVLPLLAAAACILVFAVACLIERFLRPQTKQSISVWAKRAFGGLLFLQFYLYMKVSTKAFEIFYCSEVDGVPYLVADMSLRCDTDEHLRYEIGAAIVLVLFTGGIPALFLVLLLKMRKAIKAGSDVIFCRFLYEGYSSSVFWWELTIMARKIIIVLIVVFLPNAAFWQAYIGVWVVLLSLAAHSICKPYQDKVHYYLEMLALTTLLVTLMGGLLYWRDIPDGAQLALTVILVFINCLMVLGIIVVGLLTDNLTKAVRRRVTTFLRKRTASQPPEPKESDAEL